jgi:hypothetical protein
MIQLWQKAMQRGRWLNEQTHGWLGLLAERGPENRQTPGHD